MAQLSPLSLPFCSSQGFPFQLATSDFCHLWGAQSPALHKVVLSNSRLWHSNGHAAPRLSLSRKWPFTNCVIWKGKPWSHWYCMGILIRRSASFPQDSPIKASLQNWCSTQSCLERNIHIDAALQYLNLVSDELIRVTLKLGEDYKADGLSISHFS